MRKRKFMIVLAVIIALAIPFSVFAATSNTPAAKSVRSFFGIDPSKLTDKQKADISDYNKKMADLQKDFINKMVADGVITKEQGDAAIKQIDDMLNNANKNGMPYIFGMGRKGFGRGDFGLGKIDTSKLTQQQKTELIAIYKEMANLQKDLVNKLVSEGLITKNQGDTAINKIDNMINNIEKNGLANCRGLMIGGMDGFGFVLKDIDTSKLTQQQKTEIINYFKKMAELQKQLVNKFVSFGLITKDQGSAITSRIDNMQKNIEQNGLPQGFHKGFRMGRGHFGGEWHERGNQQNGTQQNSTQQNNNGLIQVSPQTL